MRLCWLPYLKISYGFGQPNEISIGKARFVSDTDENWMSETKRSRPEYLKIFRDFPPVVDGEKGEPIYGTLVFCDDEDWLSQHIESAISILFFLGDKTSSGIPAEVFTYKPIHLTSDTTGNELVMFNTKHGPVTESGESVVLYPPLGVRGNQDAYRVDLERKEHQTLLSMFVANPNDRIAVAVRQYFRAQFTDVFSSTFVNDYATFCSATEAALNIESGIGTGDDFTTKLSEIYGTANDLELFFLGWYGARSRHVHGASEVPESTEIEKKRTKAYTLFRGIGGKWTIIRAVCREVILRALGYQQPEFSWVLPDAAAPFLNIGLYSDKVWKDAKRLLTDKRAADKIQKFSEREFDEVRDVAGKISGEFEWGCVREKPEPKELFRGLITCAILIGRLTDSKGSDYVASDILGKAADSEDSDVIGDWLWENLDWKEKYPADRLETIQLLMWNLASFFRK